MEVKKIATDKLIDISQWRRPQAFDDFLGQEHIKEIVQTTIDSAKKRNSQIWHTLFSWPSWFWKTTIANIIAKQMDRNIKAITWYAINKPAEIISILNSLEDGEILFIDEIHRLKPNVEEVLYIAMEDFVIDMVMPDGWNMRIPISPFTLIWATTMPEKLTKPLKNRFVYNHHFMDYTDKEKQQIIKQYLEHYELNFQYDLLFEIHKKVDAVPREIHNLCVKIRDFVISKQIEDSKYYLDEKLRNDFVDYMKIEDWGLTLLHQKYLDILREYDRPLWSKTIAIQMWINEKALEEDIEPLLLKLWKIEKTNAWRLLVK